MFVCFFPRLSEITLVRPLAFPTCFAFSSTAESQNESKAPWRHIKMWGFLRNGRVNHSYICRDQTRRFTFLTAEVIYWYLAILVPLHKDIAARAIFFFLMWSSCTSCMYHFQETQGQIVLEPDWKWEKFTVWCGSINAIRLIKTRQLFMLAIFEQTFHVHWFL